jgi:hypothetical protein
MKFREQVVACTKLYKELKIITNETNYKIKEFVKKAIQQPIPNDELEKPSFKIWSMRRTLWGKQTEIYDLLQEFNLLARIWAKLTWRI